MDKVKNLKEKAKTFHQLLENETDDLDAARLLKWLAPLFIDIEAGKVTPPRRYEFRMALGKDAKFYERHDNIGKAEADFVSALEDWPSQEWYLRLSENIKK